MSRASLYIKMFRGKDRATREWRYGSYVTGGDRWHIAACRDEEDGTRLTYEVDCVGQAVGKTLFPRGRRDENGKQVRQPVYEGDFVGIFKFIQGESGETIRKHIATIYVKWHDFFNMPIVDFRKGSIPVLAEELNYFNPRCLERCPSFMEIPFTFFYNSMNCLNRKDWDWEVIGNEHDNPELLKNDWT